MRIRRTVATKVYNTDNHLNGTTNRVFTAAEQTKLAGLAPGKVVFPAVQVASADVNTLDDYEEGTTTPAPTSGTGAFTTVSCSLNYTKIGNRVSWNAVITITTNGTAATDISIALPFTSGEAASAHGLEVNTTGRSVQAQIASGSATCAAIRHVTDLSYPGGAGYQIRIGGTYRV